MIAPHSLALLGNLAGAWGRWLPMGLISAAIVYLLNLLARARLNTPGNFFEQEFVLYRRFLGPLPALVAPLAGRLVTALAGATGLLVTAGFAFNETFLYWFPNFAFAYLLLGAVVAIHFFGPRVVQGSQWLFILVALGGLLVLLGVAVGGFEGPPLQSDSGSAGPGIRSWAPLLLLFVGVELAFLYRPEAASATLKRYTAMMISGLLMATLLLALWGWVAIRFVPLERLATTTIAPVVVAKQVWGQPGRYTMGVVTIAGTLAAVNALFSVVVALVDNVFGRYNTMSSGRRIKVSPIWVVVLLGAATAALMALGMAGTEEIDVALRAGLVLWILHYALVAFLVLRGTPQEDIQARVLAGFAGGLMLVGGLTLSYYDPDRQVLLLFMASAVIVATLFGVGGGWLVRLAAQVQS